MNRKRKEKVKWWRRFWPPIIIACSVPFVVDCILYLSGYTDQSILCSGILLVFGTISLALVLFVAVSLATRGKNEERNFLDE